MTTRKKSGHRRGGGGSNMVPEVPYFGVNNMAWGRPGGGGGWAMAKSRGMMEGKFEAWPPNAKLIPGTRFLQAGHVHVTYPHGKAAQVAKLFEDHKRVTWETMANHLAKIGACFSPWRDGAPGHSPAYTRKG